MSAVFVAPIVEGKGEVEAVPIMPAGYDPPNHQPLFTQHFSLAQAAAVPSFARLGRKVQQLCSP